MKNTTGRRESDKDSHVEFAVSATSVMTIDEVDDQLEKSAIESAELDILLTRFTDNRFLKMAKEDAKKYISDLQKIRDELEAREGELKSSFVGVGI